MRGIAELRLAVGRTRADWPIALAAFLLLLSATALLATAALYGETVGASGIQRAFEGAPVGARAVRVEVTATGEGLAAADAAVRGVLADTPGLRGDVARVLAPADPYALAGAAAEDSTSLVQLAAYDGIDAHATLLAGRWATPSGGVVEATLSRAAADALGVRLGDRMKLVDRLGARTELTIVVVGVWQPDPNDAFWQTALERQGTDEQASFRTRGPLVLTAPDLIQRTAGGLRAEWRALPDIARLRPNDLPALRAGLSSMADRLALQASVGRSARVTSDLPEIVARVERGVLVAGSAVALVTIQFAVLAVYAILLVAGMLLEWRRADVAVLRSRGATTRRLVSLAFTEALLLAIPAAIAAPFLAWAAVSALAAAGPLQGSGVAATAPPGPGVVLVAVLGALAGVAVLTLPSLVGGASPALARVALGRQIGRTLAQRLGLDLVLLVLAGIALWQMRLYGSPLLSGARGSLGVDPLLVVAPALGLVAGATIATRALPRVTELAERAFDRSRGVVSPLVARQLARRPLRYTRTALLLMLATALGIFASAYAATWSQSQHDQAAYRAAADVRVLVADYGSLPEWAAGSAYRSIVGVRAATPVGRQPLDVGRAVRSGTLLGVDGRAASEILVPSSSAEAGGIRPELASLAVARPSLPVVEITGTPRRLALRLDAALRAADTTTALPDGWQGLRATALLRDADGRLQRFEGGVAAFDRTGQLVEIPLVDPTGSPALSPAYPLGLEGVELTMLSPAGVLSVGTVDLVDVEASDDVGGTAWRIVGTARDVAGRGWRWTRIDPDQSLAYPADPSAPGRVTLTPRVGPTAPVGSYPYGGATFRWWGPPTRRDASAELPVLASDGFLRLTGTDVGDAVSGTSAGQTIRMRITAAVHDFPTLDPGVPFVVADLQSVEIARFEATGTFVGTREWWLAAPDDAGPSVAAALSAGHYGAAEVVARSVVERDLMGDPVSLGILGALAVGSAAAAAFAAIGFVVGATVAARERLMEFGLLRAIGVSAGELTVALVAESAFLLGFGLLAGTLLGLLLAWLVLPFATLTASGLAAVPAPTVLVPPEAIVPVWLAGAAVLGVASVLVTRRVRSIPLAAVLRGRDA